MAEPQIKPGPTTSYFDTSDRPSMGDPEFVDTQVRAMFDEARRILFEHVNPPSAVAPLVDKWAKQFSPANDDYVQTLSVASLNKFLRDRGIGTNDAEDDALAPVRALVATTLDRFVEASIAYHEEKTDDEQLKFAIDTAAEDFVSLIRGLDNPAD